MCRTCKAYLTAYFVLLANGTLCAYSPECIKIVQNTSNAPDGVLVYSKGAFGALCAFFYIPNL